MQNSFIARIADPPDKVAYALLAAAVLLTLGIYGLHAGDFFILDSVDVIGTNVGLRFDASDFDSWRVAALSSDRGLFNRPLSNLSFAIDAQLAGGIDGQWIKLHNLVLHVITGFVAWRMLLLALSASPLLGLETRRARWMAAITIGIWLIHPLHVSTVMYAVQRMTQLSTLFVLAGLWFYMVHRLRWLEQAPDAKDYSSVLLGMTVAMLLASLCKENGALLPLYAAVLELCLFRGRVAGGQAMLPYRLSQLALLATAMLILLLGIIGPDWLVNRYTWRNFDLAERVLTQLRVLWQYLGWIALWDMKSMGVFHDDVRVSASLLQPLSSLVALVAWVSIAALAWVLRNRHPLLGFALLWYLAGHSMESTIIPLELVFEHRNYLPSLGPFLLFAWAVTAVPAGRYGIAATGTAAALVLLGWLLLVRTSYWSSELVLAETQYRHHPDSRRSQLHLANTHVRHMARERDRQAMQQHFMAARELHWRLIQRDRDYVPSLFSLISLESLARRPEEVQRLYQQMASALDKPTITPTEFSGLKGVVTCVDSGSCYPPAGGIREYLERLVRQRDSQKPRELLIRHCLASQDHDCVRENAEASLAVDNQYVYGYLALYLSSKARGDVDGGQRVAQRMLKADTSREQISGVRDSLAATRQ